MILLIVIIGRNFLKEFHSLSRKTEVAAARSYMILQEKLQFNRFCVHEKKCYRKNYRL